jgi:hypothetical protein
MTKFGDERSGTGGHRLLLVELLLVPLLYLGGRN